ncbi:MAG: HD domain-containing protein [Dehalococcoidales bacterium]|nr:HD domain-containing protein [Dehalococcoidales bacterium]
MYDEAYHEQLIGKINAFLDTYQSDHSYCHGADHVHRVTKLAVMIGEIEKLDCQIIEVASLLHDCGMIPLAWGRHASGEDTYDFQNFLGRYALPSADHGEVGELIAGRFLRENGYPEEKLKLVTQIIREHNKGNQTTPESQVVNDADKLEAIGATWIARAFQRTNAFDRTVSIESVPANYLENRRGIVDSFHTETARKMGEKRFEFMTAFIEQFRKEMDLEA